MSPNTLHRGREEDDRGHVPGHGIQLSVLFLPGTGPLPRLGN